MKMEECKSTDIRKIVPATLKISRIGDYLDVLQTASVANEVKVKELKSLWSLWEGHR